MSLRWRSLFVMGLAGSVLVASCANDFNAFQFAVAGAGGGGRVTSASSGGGMPECIKDGDCAPGGKIRQCLTYACSPQHTCEMPVNQPAGTPCTEDNGSVCDSMGGCVPCNKTADCKDKNKICMQFQCVQGNCMDGVTDGDETDVDCGGSCPKKCDNAKKCLKSSDCASGYCVPQGGGGGAGGAGGAGGGGGAPPADTCAPCGKDAECAMGQFCCTAAADCPAVVNFITAVCAAAKMQGDACGNSDGRQCASGFCVDGFCCDKACDNAPCDRCAKGSGAAADGTCTALSNKTVCYQGSGDVCDPTEMCTGTLGQPCPMAQTAKAGTVCYQGSGDVCDPAQTCNGMAGQKCPAAQTAKAGAVCYPGSGDVCDPTQKCSGMAGQKCPAAQTQPNGSLCIKLGANGNCDAGAKCSGMANQPCPADSFPAKGGTVAGFCDAMKGGCGNTMEACACDGGGAASADCKVASGAPCMMNTDCASGMCVSTKCQ